MDRVFLDANVLFSAAYRDTSALARLWTVPDVTLITSRYAIEEARRNFDKPEQQSRLLRLVDAMVVFPDESIVAVEILGVDLPVKDWPILWAAVVAKSTHLLTGDLRHFGPYFGQSVAGVLILRPADYLSAQDAQ